MCGVEGSNRGNYVSGVYMWGVEGTMFQECMCGV